MTEHAGRVALVTGGSRGIGRGGALELARQGSAVAVHGLNDGYADEVVDEITTAGGRAIAVVGNIEDPTVAEAAVAATIDEFGRLDTLVTSAGIQRYGDVVTTSRQLWDEVFAVNVTGVYLACHFAMPHLRQSPAGSVVIVASVQATATQSQVVAYASSKGALVSMARAMAIDEAQYGVRVNTISPGSVDTPMLRASAAGFSDGSAEGIETVLRGWGTAHALGRVAQPEEVGAAISFISSPRASFITGDDIRVDGGLLARAAAAIPTTQSGHDDTKGSTHDSTR
jgi:NAD(P)-dependent dehydrogenase (short-subunit alcohol dehydrogenase family)